MRITISLDDDLLARAKKLAGQRGQMLGELVEEAVRFRLLAFGQAASPVRLPVFTGGRGARPGIDLSSNRALYDALDDEDGVPS